MRLSSLSVAAVLLLSSIAFAQHHDAGSAPSAPPPSPPPAAAPSPAPAPPPPPPPAPSPAPSYSPPAPSVSHSAPSPAPSIPESHVAPAPSPSPGPSPAPGAGFGAARSESNSDKPAPVARTPEPDRVGPAENISGENRVEAVPRVGEHLPEKDRTEKPAEPDLRRRACEGSECKDTVAKPAPPESDLRRKTCIKGICGCPAGQTAAKGGCVTTVVSNPETQCQPGTVWNGSACTDTSPASPTACPAGKVWNGGVCVPVGQCPAGQIWNGTTCASNCSIVNSQAQNLIVQLRNAHRERDDACRQDPAATLCLQLDGQYNTLLAEYRNAVAGAPVECRATLPDPSAL